MSGEVIFAILAIIFTFVMVYGVYIVANEK